MEATEAYLRDLRDELRDANRRLASADEEGIPVVLGQICEIERDIVRYSAILEDPQENEGHETSRNHTELLPTTEARKKRGNTDFASCPAPMGQ